MNRPPRPAFSSATTRSSRLLPVFSASAGESLRACCATRWASARLSRSRSRPMRAKWSSGPETAARSAAIRTRMRRSPNIWPSRAFSNLPSQPSGTSTTAAGPRNSIRPTRLRSSPPTRSRKSKQVGLAGATRQGLKVEKRHDLLRLTGYSYQAGRSAARAPRKAANRRRPADVSPRAETSSSSKHSSQASSRRRSDDGRS